jgi:hypothetical protein
MGQKKNPWQKLYSLLLARQREKSLQLCWERKRSILTILSTVYTNSLHELKDWIIFGELSDPLFLSSSSALHFFRLLFSCPPPCQPGWPSSPCTCNGSDFTVASQYSQREQLFLFFFLWIKLYALIRLGVSPPSLNGEIILLHVKEKTYML